jgi:hypothetical protein
MGEQEKQSQGQNNLEKSNERTKRTTAIKGCEEFRGEELALSPRTEEHGENFFLLSIRSQPRRV